MDIVLCLFGFGLLFFSFYFHEHVHVITARWLGYDAKMIIKKSKIPFMANPATQVIGMRNNIVDARDKQIITFMPFLYGIFCLPLTNILIFNSMPIWFGVVLGIIFAFVGSSFDFKHIWDIERWWIMPQKY